jgi:hypothetical protein
MGSKKAVSMTAAARQALLELASGRLHLECFHPGGLTVLGQGLDLPVQAAKPGDGRHAVLYDKRGHVTVGQPVAGFVKVRFEDLLQQHWRAAASACLTNATPQALVRLVVTIILQGWEKAAGSAEFAAVPQADPVGGVWLGVVPDLPACHGAPDWSVVHALFEASKPYPHHVPLGYCRPEEIEPFRWVEGFPGAYTALLEVEDAGTLIGQPEQSNVIVGNT